MPRGIGPVAGCLSRLRLYPGPFTSGLHVPACVSLAVAESPDWIQMNYGIPWARCKSLAEILSGDAAKGYARSFLRG